MPRTPSGWAPLLAAALLAACSDGGRTPTPPPVQPPAPARLRVASADPHVGLAGQRAPDSVVVRVVDREDRGVSGVPVDFVPAAGAGAFGSPRSVTDAEGFARAAWTLGANPSAEARVLGIAPAPLTARVAGAPAALVPMLAGFGAYLDFARSNLERSAPLNPAQAGYFEEKLRVLRRPGFGGEVLLGERWLERTVEARASTVPVTAVYAAPAMREEADRSLDWVVRVVPVLETLMDRPFPAPAVRLWHGFVMGNSGGGGQLSMEDRATYQLRTPESRLPYDAILAHELGHSFFASESLTQFLELYAYNLLLTGSESVDDWVFDRGYQPDRELNEDVHALLDVYRALGPAAMKQALRRVQPMGPPYGQPLPPAAQQVFVELAPEASRAVVAARIARVHQ